MPYNPTVNDRSGEIRMQGLLSAIQSLTSGAMQAAGTYEKDVEETKTLQAQNKAYETLLKTGAPQLGIDPNSLDQLLATSPDESARARNAKLQTALSGAFTARELKSRGIQDQLATTQLAGEQQRQSRITRDDLDALSQRGRMRTIFGGTPSGQEMDAMIRGGSRFADLSPGQAPATGAEAVRRTLAAGIDDPRLLASIGKYAETEPFTPSMVDLGNGTTAMMTSPRSAVPISKPAAKPEAYNGGPLLSPDLKFYRSGPGDAWKPLPKEPTGAKLDPMVIGSIEEQIGKLENEKVDHQTEIAKGDKRTGFLNYQSRQDRLVEIDNQLKGLRATLRAAGPASRTGAAKPADVTAGIKW